MQQASKPAPCQPARQRAASSSRAPRSSSTLTATARARAALLGRRGLRVAPARDAAGAATPRSRPRSPCAWRAPSPPGRRRARSRWPAARRRSRPPSPAPRPRRCPTPASRITGTRRGLDDQAQVVGVVDAHAAADRRAQRHHRRAARVLEPARQDRVVVGVGQDDEAVGRPASRPPRAARPGSGSSVRSSPITSSLTQSVPSASRARRAVVTASRAVKQPAVLGSTSSPRLLEHLEDRAARASGPRGASPPWPAPRPTRARRRPSSRGCGSRPCRGSAAT